MSRYTVIVAWLAIAAAAVVPPEGLGFSICWFRFVTRLPCPGCGLVRSMSATLRGDVARAAILHPLGPVALALFAAVAILGVLPRGVQKPILSRISARASIIQSIYMAGVVILIVFGLVRMGLTAWGQWPILAM